jgi:hypothetical protein
MKKKVLYIVDIYGDHSRVGLIDKVFSKWHLTDDSHYVKLSANTRKDIINYFMTSGYAQSYYIKTED